MNGLSPILLLHIATATIGLISGYLAMILRKGTSLHRIIGNVFFGSMLAMSSSAVFIAIAERPNALNVVVGSLTFYLVATSWRTARRREAATDRYDRIALVFIALVAIAAVAWGIEAVAGGGRKDNIPAGMYFFFAAGAALAVRSDVRMLRRGGVAGPERIARHLLRMCFALLIASVSLFPGQAKLFPPELRKTGLLVLPHVFLIGSMIFWRWRVKRKTPAGPPASGNFEIGGAGRDRTDDLLIANEALSQLSYSPTFPVESTAANGPGGMFIPAGRERGL